MATFSQLGDGPTTFHTHVGLKVCSLPSHFTSSPFLLFVWAPLPSLSLPFSLLIHKQWSPVALTSLLDCARFTFWGVEF